MQPNRGPLRGAPKDRARRLTIKLRRVALLLAALSVVPLALGGSAEASYPTSPPYPNDGAEVTFTPSSTPGEQCYQTYTVPARVTELEVRAYGADGLPGVDNTVDGLWPSSNYPPGNTGAGSKQPGGLGGAGSEVDTTISVTPGETLYVGPASAAFTGGGGGLAGMYSGDQGTTAATQATEPGAGGNGGDASFVSTQPPTTNTGGCTFSPSQLSSVLVVAAGGGGGGGAGSGQDTTTAFQAFGGQQNLDSGGDGGTEASDNGVAESPGQSGKWTDWTVGTDLHSDGFFDAGSGGANATSVPANKTACPSIAPANLNDSTDLSYQGGCSGNGGTGDTFWQYGFNPLHSGAPNGNAAMYCPAGEAGADGVSLYGGDGGNGWQAPDANNMEVNPTSENLADEYGSDLRSLVKEALQNRPDPTTASITEESMAAEEADSSLWIKTNPMDEFADTMEAGVIVVGITFLDDFWEALNGQQPTYSVIGCGGEDSIHGTTANGWIPGASTGGGGGGGGGWYGGGGGGAADDSTYDGGGGGGGAGASYVTGQSFSQTSAQTSADSFDTTGQVILNPVQTPPAIVDTSNNNCVYGSSGCASGPTYTCVINGACSETLQTTGRDNPWVSFTAGSTLGNNFNFAEVVPGTSQYQAAIPETGAAWSPANAPPNFTLEGPWNLYSSGSGEIPNLCSLAGTSHTYDNAIEASNDAGSYTLPTLTINYSPGNLQSVSTYPDAGAVQLIEDQAVFPGGNPLQFDATAAYDEGCQLAAANDSGATWSSSNPSVATVSAGSGVELVQPVGPGSTTITFSDKVNGVTRSATYPLTVQQGIPSRTWLTDSNSGCVAGGTGLSSLTLVPGQTDQMHVCADYGNGNVEDVTRGITWQEGSGLDQAGLVVNPGVVGTQPGEFLVGQPWNNGATAQPSLSGTVTADLDAWGPNGEQVIQTNLPVTVNWANPTSLAITGGLAPGQEALSNEQLQFTGTATYDNGETVNVSQLANWTTSNSNLAASDGGGAFVTPYYENGGYDTIGASLGSQSASEQIAVESSLPPTITVTDADQGTVGLGQTDQLTAAAFTGGPLTQQLNPDVTWSSDEPNIATVNASGVVTVLSGAQGQQFTIRATDGLYQGMINLKVNLQDPTTITIAPGTASVGSGGSVTFTATGHYPGGLTANISSLANWSTNQPSTVAVFQSYQLQVAPNQTSGSLVIGVQASLGNVAPPAYATVTEGLGPPSNLVLASSCLPTPKALPTSPLSPGQTVQLAACAQYGSGPSASYVDVTNNVTWASTNASVFTVSPQGLATAVGDSNLTATVYAAYNDQSVTYSGSAGLTETLTNPLSVAVTPADPTLLPGQNEALTATGTYPDGSTADISRMVTWSSTCGSDECADGSGLLEAGDQAGTATLTAAAPNGVSGSTTFTGPGGVTLSPANPSPSTITAGVPFTSQAYTAGGGSGSYTWSLGGPGDIAQSGLSVSSTTGSSVQIVGTPSAQFWQDWGSNTVYLQLTATDPNNIIGFSGSSTTIYVPVKLTQLQQSISWTTKPPATAQTGTTIDLSNYAPTSTSGLGVSYSVSYNTGYQLCSLNGTKLTFSLAVTGTCTVTATANSNAEYASAPTTVSTNIIVSAPLTTSWMYAPPAYVQAYAGCGASPTSLGSCGGPATNGAPSSYVVATSASAWNSGANSGVLSGPNATLSIDPSTTGYGTPGVVCTITGTEQVNWLLPGTCVIDANTAGGTYGPYNFSAAPQLQATTQIAGFLDSLSFRSTTPSRAKVGGNYTPSFTTVAPEGANINPVAGQPATSPSPATPVVTVDSSGTTPAGACTTDGTTVRFVHAGTCVVGAYQPVDGVYGRSTVSSEQTITIGQGPQTIGFGSEASGSYVPGDTVTLAPTPGGSGNAVALSIDSSSAGVCTINAQDQITFDTPGSCQVDASEAGSGDYLAGSASETLTVQNVTPVIVTAVPCSSSYSAFGCVGAGGVQPAAESPASAWPNMLLYVALENPSGQVVVPNHAVTVDLASATAGAGSAPAFAVAGQLASQVTIPAGSPEALVFYGDQIAGARTLTATAQLGSESGTVSGTLSATIDAGRLASLAWASQPPDGVIASPLNEFDVTALDQFGNPVPGVDVALSATDSQNNPATINQDGSETTNSSGVAQFQSVEFGTPGTYTLSANAPGTSVTSPASSPFTVAAGAVQSLDLTGGPTGPVTAGAPIPTIDVQAFDGSSDPVPNVPLRLTYQRDGHTITLATGETGADGSAATFTGLTIRTPGSGPITATDTDDGATGLTAPFTVTPVVHNLTNAYVSASGSDSNTCLQATPCATITGADAELASSGGTIHVSGTIDESGIVLDATGVSVVGVPGTGATVDGGSSGSSIFTISDAVGQTGQITISGLALTNGHSSGGNGGAIMDDSAGRLLVADDTFSGDSADNAGGAIYASSGGSLVVSSSDFQNDSSGQHGGAIESGDGAGDGQPGDALGGGTLLVTDSTFTGNSSNVGGAIDGGETNGGGTVSLVGSTFANNSAGAIASALVTGSGSSYLAGDLIDGDCAGNGTVNDQGHNGFSDPSCYPSGSGTGDHAATSAAGDFTGQASDGTMQLAYDNPANALIPAGTTIMAGGTTFDLCSASDQAALHAPHAIQTPSGARQVCNAGSAQNYATAVPQAPSKVSATATTTGSAKVTWTAPTDSGGLALTGYRVTATSQAGSPATTLTAGPTAATASFSSLSPGTYTFTVTADNSAGQSQDSSPSAIVAVGPSGKPAQLKFQSTPGGTQAGQALGQFGVLVRDSQGKPVGGVTVSLSALPAGGGQAQPVQGQKSQVTNASGIATFSNSSIDLVGDYTLEASVSNGSVQGQSTTFSIAPSAPASVAFTQQPTDGSLGTALAQYAVAVYDRFGNPVPGADVRITLPDGTQADDASTDGQGVATFSTTTIDAAGTYTLTATATAGSGATAASDSFDVAPSPDAPSGVAASNNDVTGQASINWTDPSDTSGLPITGYVITAYGFGEGGSPDGAVYGETIVNDPNATSAQFGGLVGKFMFTVTAESSLGVTGAESDPSSPILVGAAGIPAELVFTQQPTTAQSQQTMPAVQVQALDADGNGVSGQTITLGGAGGIDDHEVTDGTGTATFSGDSIQQLGTFTLTAEAFGTGNVGGTPVNYDIDAQSNPFEVTAGPPASLEITWNPNSSIAGQPLSDVGVYVSDLNNNPVFNQSVTLGLIDMSTGQPPAGWQDVTAASVSDGTGDAIAQFHNVTIAHAGTYEFVATAGSTTTTSPSFTLTGTPDAPTGVSATANADGTVSLSWTAPDDLGNLPLSGNTITAYDPGGDAVAQTTLPYVNTNYTFTGLQEGESYTFTVTSINMDGLGTESAKSNTVTVPATVPAQPAPPSGFAAPDGLHVRLSIPGANDRGDSPLTGFTMNAYDSSDNLVASQSVGTNQGVVVFPGLTAGAQYTFTEIATNGNGNSQESAASAPVTAWTSAPDAPANVTATSVVSGTAVVSWAPPDSDGGNPISDYTVTAYDVSTTSNGPVADTNDGSTTSATLSGLTPGDVYVFEVVAVNSQGPGSQGESGSVIAAGAVPGAPAAVYVNPASGGSETIAWLAPGNYDVARPTSYTVVAVDGTNTANGGQQATVSGSTYNATITGLTGGDSYTFQVTATNGNGTGPAASSSAVTAWTLPTAPRFVSASVNPDGSVTVGWTTPSQLGGSLTGYSISAVDETTSTSVGTVASASGSATSAQVTGLQGGDSYGFQVTATNSHGSGPASALSPAASPLSAPEAPTGISAKLNSDRSVTVSWTAPSNDGGSSITGFVATALDLTTPAHGGQTVTAGPSATSGTLQNLSPGDSYTFVIQAENSFGSSRKSAVSSLVTIPRLSTSLAITGAPATIVYGKPVTVTGILKMSGTPVSGQKVALLYRPLGSKGTFARFPTLESTAPTGRVSFTTFRPTTPVQIELSFGGAGAYAASTSPTVTVAETPSISLRLSTKQVKPGTTVTLTGSVAPNNQGKQVELQRQVGTKWVKVTTAKLTAASRYTFKLQTAAAGKFVYRVSMAAIGPFSSASSSTVTLTVT
jgi:hypothetical protein